MNYLQLLNYGHQLYTHLVNDNYSTPFIDKKHPKNAPIFTKEEGLAFLRACGGGTLRPITDDIKATLLNGTHYSLNIPSIK